MGEAEFLVRDDDVPDPAGGQSGEHGGVRRVEDAWLPGAAAALFGLCLMPVVLIMVAGFFYFRFKEMPAVKGVLHGASAAAVALTWRWSSRPERSA